MKVSVFDKTAKVNDTTIESRLLDLKLNSQAVAKYVRVYLSNQRESNAHVKDRSEVSGGGRKPWKQKGTGRARHGSSRSPIWRHGGVTFGPSNNVNNKLRMNKKEAVVAFVSALKQLSAEERLFLIELPEFDKTKAAAEHFAKLKLSGKIMIVQTPEQKTEAMQNIANISTKTTADVSTYDIIASKNTLFTKEALDYVLKQKESIYFKSAK